MKNKMLPGIVGICLVLANSSCATSKLLLDVTLDYAKVKLFGGNYSWELNTAIQKMDAEKVKKLLEEGADPNYTELVNIWAESNPLAVLQNMQYDSYTYEKMGKLSDPQPEIAIFNYLRGAGADIHKLPYIWLRVQTWGEWFIRAKIRNHYWNHPPEELQEHIESIVVSINQLIRALLEAGADPDMRGHPYPFRMEVKPGNMSYEKAQAYFNRGTRAINEAIRKGMVWESQVDLLLEYTSLDEDSLIAAEESGDPGMKEKIRRLWEAGHSGVSP